MRGRLPALGHPPGGFGVAPRDLLADLGDAGVGPRKAAADPPDPVQADADVKRSQEVEGFRVIGGELHLI